MLRVVIVFSLVLSSITLTPACGHSRGSNATATVELSNATHACYQLANFELCVPHPGRDRAIVARSHMSAEEIKVAVTKFSGVTESNTLPNALGPDTYDVTSLFPSFIASHFNTLANFSGPNCYNTALLATGGLPQEDRRYVSQEEFDLILSQQYEEITPDQAKFGDVLVYDARGSREHVAVYLGQNLIFHKKGVLKGYGYRITAIDNAYEYEPGEWTESPIKMLLLPADNGVIAAPRAYYRLREKSSSMQSNHPVARLIEQSRLDLLEAGPNWRVHKDFGIISEGIYAQIKKYIDGQIFEDPNLKNFLSARLTSLKDQIYLSIDEALFQTPRGMTRRDEIIGEFCFSESSPTLNRLIDGIALSYRPETPLTADDHTKLFQTFSSYDKSRCQLPVLDIVKDYLTK